jgi:hypothetical protein
MFASGSHRAARAAAARALLAAALAMSLAAAAGLRPPVAAGGGAGSRPGSAAAQATAGPGVQAMVVGREATILSGPRGVSASATSLRVRNRSCAVAAGTPLATLAALRRAGGPGFAVRDYGHCGPSPANSGQLFVYAIGGERNHAASGWEYKVDNVAGSTGAGDVSGPRGDGRRIRPGARVLWFWCEATAGGCQRTLAVSAPAAATRGGAVTVTVWAYDNEGRAAPAAGAIVTLGSDFASTGARGHATLVLPSARGIYAITAVRRGTVPSFPATIAVR